MGDVVLLEEFFQVEVGDDLAEPVILLNVFADVGLVGVSIDAIVAIVLFGEVNHLQQNIELLLVLHPCTLARRQSDRLIHFGYKLYINRTGYEKEGTGQTETRIKGKKVGKITRE